MDIINRTEAIAAGLTKYFTGERCGRGHVAPRYTVSGNCCQCVRGSVAPYHVSPETMATIESGRAWAAARNQALSMLAEIKVWAHADDIDAIRDTAVACCLREYINLTADDVTVRVGATATDGIFGQYRLKVPAEYIMTVRQLSATLSAKRAPGDTRNGPAEQPPIVQQLLEVLSK